MKQISEYSLISVGAVALFLFQVNFVAIRATPGTEPENTNCCNAPMTGKKIDAGNNRVSNTVIPLYNDDLLAGAARSDKNGTELIGSLALETYYKTGIIINNGCSGQYDTDNPKK